MSARILLVEDIDSLRAMLKLALESQGHQVIEARDEPEAVAALRDSQPALVLSDLRLPKGDGMGVLRAVKDVDAELPVIVMTAHGSGGCSPTTGCSKRKRPRAAAARTSSAIRRRCGRS